MRYCGPRGIPLSQFLAWAQPDQDTALAWQAREALRCGSCGHHPDDGPVHAHVEVCPSCAARAAASAEVRDTPGAHVHLAAGTPADCPQCAVTNELNRR